jgi:hypothetical protein
VSQQAGNTRRGCRARRGRMRQLGERYWGAGRHHPGSR